MKVNKHVCFRSQNEPELVSYLKANGIPFCESSIISSFDIAIDSPHWSYIESVVHERKLYCKSETQYTNEDIAAQEWMRVWCQSRFGYPQPENDFISHGTTYAPELICPKCGSGQMQRESFRVKKSPNWGRKHFAELNWIGDELFVSETAKNILLGAGITGISFLDVKNKSGTEVLPDMYQLYVSHILNPGLIEDISDIRQKTVCSHCGTTKYVLYSNGLFAMRKEVFDGAPDVVKTAEIFGDMHYAVRGIVIRQNVYQTIIANNLERGLVFEPIELI